MGHGGVHLSCSSIAFLGASVSQLPGPNPSALQVILGRAHFLASACSCLSSNGAVQDCLSLGLMMIHAALLSLRTELWMLLLILVAVTMQVAGTEQGVTEPEATFSACFGGAFLMWHPMKYASMLAEKMAQHGTTAWLVNTGWTGGR